MEDEGSGGGRSPGQDGDRAKAVVALAPFASPRRAKTVRMSEARDFIIPCAADQGRSSGFDVAEGNSPATAPLFLSADLDRRLSISHLCFCRCGGYQSVRRRAPRKRRGRSDPPAAAATASRRCPAAFRRRARCRTRRTTSGEAPRGTGSRRSSSSPPQSRRRRPQDLAPPLRGWLLVRNAVPRVGCPRARPWVVVEPSQRACNRKRLKRLSTSPEISKKLDAAASAHCPTN